MHRAFKFRLYPNQAEQAALATQFGHSRFVHNRGLDARKSFYKETGKGLSLSGTTKLLPGMKRELPWLKEADSQVLQQKLRDLDTAYTNFFKGRARYPKFKKKSGKQTIRYPQRFKFNGNRVYLPKVGWVKLKCHRAMEGKPKSVTVSKAKSGKHFVSILCEVDKELPKPNRLTPVGVDLGLTSFAILSTGEKVDSPRFLRKTEQQLVRTQRRLSRKKKGSANRRRARLRVALVHERIANQRADFQNKLSHRLVTEHGLVAMENLNIKGMVKNHCLAKSISDAGWSAFVRMCEYKAPWYGSEVRKVDRFFPSSKRCSRCGWVNGDLRQGDRNWTCVCGVVHDRDINAAINVLIECTVGATESQACGDAVSPCALRGKRLASTNQEAQGL